ncbi:MAG: class B sortase [Clostridia bacterium]|nr:class B sortase [Clostridia bacterium]
MKDKKNGKRKRNGAQRINTLLIVLCFLLLMVSGFYIARFYALQSETERDNERLSLMYKSAQGERTESATQNEPIEIISEPQNPIDPMIISYPRPPETIAPEFVEAHSINPDVVGFLHVPAKTVDDIELFVLQRDNEFYLTHDFYGEEKKSGALFLDEANEIWPQDQHMIIYGHNMKNGTMFARLTRYKSIDYAYNNPFVYFDTLYEKGAYVVLAAIRLPANEMLTEGFNVRTFTFGDTSFRSFMYDIRKNALYVTNVGADENDQLLSLITCAYNEDDERFLLITRRIRENETEESLKQMIK